MIRILAILLAASLALGISAPARADMFKPSKQQQVQLGKRAAQELRQKEKVLPESDPRVRTLRRVATRLLSTFHDKTSPWEWTFDVIESKQINAFALPGGATFFYTGLLDKLKSEDELAGVMGHEMTHVRKEHWAYAYADSQKRNLGLNLLLILGHASNTVANLASISNQLVFDLPFSRKHESEADDGGFDMMVAAGYNPQGMADVFKMLRDTSKGGQPAEFLSDHPSDDKRIKHIEDRIKQGSGSYPTLTPLEYH